MLAWRLGGIASNVAEIAARLKRLEENADIAARDAKADAMLTRRVVVRETAKAKED